MHKKRAPAFAGASFILTVTAGFFGQIDAKLSAFTGLAVMSRTETLG